MTISKFAESKDKTKRDNSAIKISGAHFTPLLIGKAQLGLACNTQRELLLEELLLRGIAVDRKMSITKLKYILMNNEYPGDSDSWKLQNFFNPKLFNAPDWSKDVMQQSLEKLSVFRSTRVEE